ncbi:MAG: TetR/AcrR family transcriptional regulator [Opitutaceae bacterium]|jgi:AcrR family transcriptional regulator
MRAPASSAKRARFFAHGYSAFTMADLATELGMSKKTLYVHFRGKHAIIRAVIDEMAAEIRADAETVLHDSRLTFVEKLRGFVQGMIERLASADHTVMRDLQRFAPDLHRYIEQMRSRNIPYIFGRFVEEGQLCGAVCDDVSPIIAVEFLLHAVQGMMQPAVLKRLRLGPPDVFENSINLFFGGLLTPAGRKEYEKFFPR